MNKNFTIKKTGGYALLELLFYVSFFAAMSLVVISSMLTMTRSFRETAIYSELAQSSGALERIVREIRGAGGILTVGAGNLKLGTTDESGAPKTVEFVLDGTDLKFLENDVLTGSLNAPDVNVNTLVFTEITTASGKAVKIFWNISSDNDKLGRTFDFYDTVVLRGSY